MGKLESLTRREHDVMIHVQTGKSNKEIAALLGIAPATVGKHLEQIFRKLGAKSRTAAAMMFAASVQALPNGHSSRNGDQSAR